MELCQLLQHQGEVPGTEAPPTLRSVIMGTVQETSEILMLLKFIGELPSLSALADLYLIYTWLYLPVLEQVHGEVSY